MPAPSPARRFGRLLPHVHGLPADLGCAADRADCRHGPGPGAASDLHDACRLARPVGVEGMNDQTTPATAEEVIASLDAAHAALLAAAEAVASRYGPGAQQATQLCGAALMISEDWVPAIRAEVCQ